MSASPVITPPLHLLAALDESGAVGLNNALPWSHPEDLKRFQALTEGHPVVMGRKTFESLGRPLPRRTNVVLSRDPTWAHRTRAAYPDVVVLPDEAALMAWTAASGAYRWFAIGGPAIWAWALPRAARLHLTEVRGTHPADTYFPAWDSSAWREVLRDERTGFVFRDLIPATHPWADPAEELAFERPRAYVGLDGAVADFARGARACKMNPDDYTTMPGAYRHLHVVPGVEQGLAALEASGWAVWIVTTPPANNPHAASEKLLWLHERWPGLRHRVVITFDKGRLGKPGDLLIDGSYQTNANAFRGRFVGFGPGLEVEDWATLVQRLPEWGAER